MEKEEDHVQRKKTEAEERRRQRGWWRQSNTDEGTGGLAIQKKGEFEVAARDTFRVSV